MLDIGLQELLVIFVIALLVCGPRRLPEWGRALGRAMREFRRASDEFRSTIETNLMEEPAAQTPPAAPSPFPDGTAGLPPLPDEVLTDATYASVDTDHPALVPSGGPCAARGDIPVFFAGGGGGGRERRGKGFGGSGRGPRRRWSRIASRARS